MKTARFSLVMMIAAGLLQGVSSAAQASLAPQAATSQSTEKSAERQKDEVHNDKDRARPKQADQSQEHSADVMRPTTKNRSIASHSKPVPIHQSRPAKTPAKNSPQTGAPASVAPPEQTGLKACTNISKIPVSHHAPSASPSFVSVNGQQFKNSRDPGARLAASGGPPTSPRGTVALNGTNVKRKP